MKRIWRALTSLLVLATVVVLYGLVIFSAAAAERSDAEKTTVLTENNVYVKGTLLSLQCILGGKDKGCPLWGYNYDQLIIMSDKRTLYRLDFNDVPRWKADKGFGKRVIITGERRGQNIVVRDLVPLEGGGKISKACL